MKKESNKDKKKLQTWKKTAILFGIILFAIQLGSFASLAGEMIHVVFETGNRLH
jgi:hypothetical protein